MATARNSLVTGNGPEAYNSRMEKKIFWASFTILGLAADLVLPFWWALGATIPLIYVSWWIAYRSKWF
jgi:hypothetical protein